MKFSPAPEGGSPGPVHFGMLGPLEARRGEELLDLGPPKQKAVLAALLISANQVVSLDRLTEMLWGADVPARAHGSIQAYIHNLRKVLEPGRAVRSQAQVLVTQPPGYVLQVDAEALDASKFELLAAEGHKLLARAHPAAAKERLVEALALWRGPALAEFAFEQFAQPEAARLEQIRTTVQEDLLEAELALGNHAAVIGDITLAVGEHPLRERLWSLLMLALYRSGRQGDALRAFAMARHTLAEELGIDPSPALRSLEAAILAQSPELDYYRPEAWSGEPASLSDATAVALANPAAYTTLVGRENELRQLLAAASQAQGGHGGVALVSGEAGIGKTRLVEEVAAEIHGADRLVVWGRANEREGAPAYWLWLQVVGELVRRSDPDRLHQALASPRAEVLRPLLPDLDEVGTDGANRSVRSWPPVPPPDSPSERFALFEAATRFLVEMADGALLVIILEDLHWADEFSLQLLEHVAARLQASHVLVLATCRPPENHLEPPLTETLGSLVRLPIFDWIELDGLTNQEVGRLLAQSGARAAPAQVSEIYARTDGNPFFVLTFGRVLASHTLSRSSVSGLVPSTVKAAVRRRLIHIPDNTRDVLVVAAAMGRDFDVHTVAPAMGVELDDVVNWLQPAVLGGVVTENGASPGVYRFSHGLVRDILRDEIAGVQRCNLHEFANQVAGEHNQPDGDHVERSQQACG